MNGKGVIIGIIALIILFVLVIGFRGGDKEKSDAPADVSSKASEEIFGRTGDVVSVGSDSVVIEDDGERYTILIDDRTVIIRRTLPRVLPKTGGESLFISPENISISNIKVGEKLSASSRIDVSGLSEFLAIQIQTVIIK